MAVTTSHVLKLLSNATRPIPCQKGKPNSAPLKFRLADDRCKYLLSHARWNAPAWSLSDYAENSCIRSQLHLAMISLKKKKQKQWHNISAAIFHSSCPSFLLPGIAFLYIIAYVSVLLSGKSIIIYTERRNFLILGLLTKPQRLIVVYWEGKSNYCQKN